MSHRTGIIYLVSGPSGSGKTTLLRVVANEESVEGEKASIFLHKSVNICFLHQDPEMADEIERKIRMNEGLIEEELLMPKGEQVEDDGGMRYPSARIVTMTDEGWERLQPVAMVRSCQPI